MGKAAYFVFLNPLCPREAHYKIFWIPYMPKRLGKLYLKMRGFNPEFFERHVNYITPKTVIKLLEKDGMNVDSIMEKRF